jgi:hypothetical protein
VPLRRCARPPEGERAAVEGLCCGALDIGARGKVALWRTSPVGGSRFFPAPTEQRRGLCLPAPWQIAAVRWLAGEPQVGHCALFFRLGLGFFRVIRIEFESPSFFPENLDLHGSKQPRVRVWFFFFFRFEIVIRSTLLLSHLFCCFSYPKKDLHSSKPGSGTIVRIFRYI